MAKPKIKTLLIKPTTSLRQMLRVDFLLVKHWWRRQDRRYGLTWRLANAFLAAIILAGIVVPIAQDLLQVNSYQLNADALKLVGNTDKSLSKQLTYDSSTGSYQFNASQLQSSSTNDALAMLKHQQAQVGTASGKGNDKSLYALNVPTDFSQGVTYHDTNSQLNFSLVPQFSANPGKEMNGHLVFPMSGGNKAIYTLKNNGLKEDIVVPKATQDSMTFSYKLHLPNTLQANVIPNSNGAIGIYSADPALFGNISYGDSSDQASIQKARVTSPKTNLVFGLPSPVIKDTLGNQVGSARFVLQGQVLQVVATGLTSIHGAFTVDPSVVVSSTSDFQTDGNNEGNIDFSTTGQITRGDVTGGSIGSWTKDTSSPLLKAEFGASSAVYKNYVYILGGITTGGSTIANTYHAPLNSDGSIGTWVADTSSPLPDTLAGEGTVIYNGYIYAIGGENGTATAQAATYYAPLNADGSIGTWVTDTSSPLPQATYNAGAVAYNNFIYELGGSNDDGSTSTTATYYAPLHADGSIGTWVTDTASPLPSATQNAISAVYNGFLYLMGGSYAVNGSAQTTVYSAQLNADGSIGTWVTDTSSPLPQPLSGTTSTLVGGYIYVIGGEIGSTLQTAVYYAQLNADGSIGTWQTDTNSPLPNTGTSIYSTTVSYNGYIYEMGGTDNTYNPVTTTYYAKIDPAGVTTSYNTSSHAPNTAAQAGVGTVAYNGYLYALGGRKTSTLTAITEAAPINADGSLGTFSSSGYTNLPTATAYMSAFAYDGYMYIVGGCTNYTCSSTTAYVYSSPISGTGTLGGWTRQSSTLPTAQYNTTAATYNGYVYVTGGTNTSVYYAALSATGSITSWSTSSHTLPTISFGAGVGINGGILYVVGGCNVVGAINTGISCTSSAHEQTSVYYAAIGSSGDLSANFTTNANYFTGGRDSMAFSIVNNCMYIAGGFEYPGWVTDTQYAPINANGSVGTWQTSTSGVLANNASQLGAASYNGTIYVMGGANGSSTYNMVQYATVNNGGGGGLGAWSSLGTGPTGPTDTTMSSDAVVYNGYLYDIGGRDMHNNYLNGVQYAQINPDGTLGTWQTTSAFLAGGDAYLGAVAYNGYMYVMGGRDYTSYYNDVQYASINNDGTLGTWHYTHNSINDGTTFVNGFSSGNQVTATTFNGYVYIIGIGSTLAQYAPINTDGTIGTWTNFTGPPSYSGSTANLTVYNNYMYYMDGAGSVQYAPVAGDGTVGTWQVTTAANPDSNYSNSTAYNGFMYVLGSLTTEYAPILSNGKLGSWSTMTDFSTDRSDGAVVAYNGQLYSVGGTTQKGTLYASANTISRSGNYSKLIDLGTTTTLTGITYNGEVPSGASNVTYKAAGQDGVFRAPALANSVDGSGGSSCAGTGTVTRYVFVQVKLDDSYGAGTSGSFPDSSGTNANMADLTITYATKHPTPNIRLKLGQTLQKGILSGFDTCGPFATPIIVGSAATASTSYGTNHGPSLTTSPNTKSGDLVMITGYVEPANEASSSASYGTFSTPAGVNLLPGFPIESNPSTITTNDDLRMYVWYYYATADGSQTLSFTNTKNLYWGLASVSIRGGPISGNPLADTAATNVTSSTASGVTSTPPVSLTLAGQNSLVLWTYTDWDGGNPGYPSGFSDQSHSTNYAGQPAMGSEEFDEAGAIGSVSAGRSGNEDGMAAALLSIRYR